MAYPMAYPTWPRPWPTPCFVPTPKSATIPVLTPSGPKWSCFLQRQVMCKGQFTVNQRYDFNPLPFQHFRWHNSTFFSQRVAVFKIDASHLEMTTCPRHRDSFGSRWQSGRPIDTILDEIANAALKSSSVKGLCCLRSNTRHMFCMFTFTFSQFVLTGSRKSLSRFTNFVFPLLEWLSVLVRIRSMSKTIHQSHSSLTVWNSRFAWLMIKY